MRRIAFLVFTLLASLSLAQYNGSIGVQSTSPADGTVLYVTGGPVQFTFDFTASDPNWNSNPSWPKASLDGFRYLVLSATVGSNPSNSFVPTNATYGLPLSVTSNKPFQVVMGVPTASGSSTLPLSRYQVGFNQDPAKAAGSGGVYTLSAVTSPTVVYTGAAGGTQTIMVYMRATVYANDLLPGTQTITIPLTVVQTP